MNFEILADVSIPKRTSRAGGRQCTYPFEMLDEGEVLLTTVPEAADDETKTKLLNRVRSAAQAWKQRTKATCGFTVSFVTEGEHAGKIGCWKVPARSRKQAAAA